MHPECPGCPLSSSPFVSGTGNRDCDQCDVVVVGTAPGKSEEQTLKAFSGKNGEVVREVFKDMDLHDSIYFTNLIPRRPTAYDGTSRKPSQGECYKCSCHMWADIVDLKPRIVVTFGQVPTTYLMGQKHQIGLIHGLPIPTIRFKHEFILIPAYDFGYVSRQGGLASHVGDEWIGDLIQVKETLGE